MPKTGGVGDECGRKCRLRIWPDNELRAVGNGGERVCGSLSFPRVGRSEQELYIPI